MVSSAGPSEVLGFLFSGEFRTALFEHLRWQDNTAGQEFFSELWPDTAGSKPTADLHVLVISLTLKKEQVLQGHRRPFHSSDLGDGGHFSRAIGQATDLHN